MVEKFSLFFLFYNALDLNNQKKLCLPSIYQFERTETNLDHPTVKQLKYLDKSDKSGQKLTKVVTVQSTAETRRRSQLFV